MPNRLYIHVGMEKTGTTSLQNYLRAHREQLKTYNIIYPESGGNQNHWGLLVFALNAEKFDHMKIAKKLENPRTCREFQESFAKKLRRELSAYKNHKILLSLEQLSSRVEEKCEIVRLQELLSSISNSVKIVFYIRPQSEYVVSWYSTRVKGGWETEPFRFPEPSDPTFVRYDYLRIIERWENVFGRENIVLRRFQPKALVEGDIISDFFDLLGSPEAARFSRAANLNASLDPVTLELVRRLNVHLGPHTTPEGVNRKRRALRRVIDSVSGPSITTLSRASREAFMRYFEQGNATIRSRYFSNHNGNLFYDEGGDDEDFFRLSISEEQLFKRFADILIALGK